MGSGTLCDSPNANDGEIASSLEGLTMSHAAAGRWGGAGRKENCHACEAFMLEGGRGGIRFFDATCCEPGGGGGGGGREGGGLCAC